MKTAKGLIYGTKKVYTVCDDDDDDDIDWDDDCSTCGVIYES